MLRALNPKRRKRKSAAPYDPAPDNPLRAYQKDYREWCLAKGQTEQGVASQAAALIRFIVWCDERGLRHPQDITRPILERYQRHLYHYRKKNGDPLSITSQLGCLRPLQGWFRWLVRDRHILYNPASDLELPRKPRVLPKCILSPADVENVINQCDVTEPLGLRNRAILETFYSTGLRRLELINLKLWDVNLDAGVVMVRQGKGRKDRVVPIGERAAAWLDKYLKEVRPELLMPPDDYTVFLHDDGRQYLKQRLGDLVKRHLEHGGIRQPGACHLFRHAMATHMLENGADIRYIQMMLGHADLATTQLYTQVSLTKLKEVHALTHPARFKRVQGANAMADDAAHADERAALLIALEAEAVEEH